MKIINLEVIEDKNNVERLKTSKLKKKLNINDVFCFKDNSKKTYLKYQEIDKAVCTGCFFQSMPVDCANACLRNAILKEVSYYEVLFGGENNERD